MGNGCDQLDESLGVVVTWSGFTTDADDSWDEFALSLVGWGIKDCKISEDNIKDVHELSLVLMNSLNLNIVHNVMTVWHIISGSLLNPISELLFVLLLDLDKLILELLIVCVWH